MLETVATSVPVERLAGHYHDTYGMAVANVHASYGFGVRVFDSSVAGLGGCPYAVGATGNVATEDIVYLMHGIGVDTGVDLEALAECGAWISAELGRPSQSRVGRALLAKWAAADDSTVPIRAHTGDRRRGRASRHSRADRNPPSLLIQPCVTVTRAVAEPIMRGGNGCNNARWGCLGSCRVEGGAVVRPSRATAWRLTSGSGSR